MNKTVLNSLWQQALLVVLLLSATVFSTVAQTPDTTGNLSPSWSYMLDNVDVAPNSIDTRGWLLLDQDIRTELDGAVYNLYNFKYSRAERQFLSLRRRYPQHPMPYFLMGLSTWWKILPSNATEKQYDERFYAYLDTAITKGENLYKADCKNYEACFFLAAAYSFEARLRSERHDWRRATVSSSRALDYLKLSREANGLTPEFLFGFGLFNYYSVWIGEQYPWLRPILYFFPKGNTELGLNQIRQVADHSVYTGPEAKVFLMRILSSEREQKSEEAYKIAQGLAHDYPDNAYFQRSYAIICFNLGKFQDCERVSRNILEKLNKGEPGYEAVSGRYATYFMGYIMQFKVRNLGQAKDYYQRCIVYSESNGETDAGFYLYANSNLGKIVSRENNIVAARQYYQVVLNKGERKSAIYDEAKTYLNTHKSVKLAAR